MRGKTNDSKWYKSHRQTTAMVKKQSVEKQTTLNTPLYFFSKYLYGEKSSFFLTSNLFHLVSDKQVEKMWRWFYVKVQKRKKPIPYKILNHVYTHTYTQKRLEKTSWPRRQDYQNKKYSFDNYIKKRKEKVERRLESRNNYEKNKGTP